MAQQKPEQMFSGQYIVIPEVVRYDKRLPPLEKLIFGEILALSNTEAGCFAANAYFANIYQVTPHYISTIIKRLAALGYVKTEVDKSRANRRTIVPITPQCDSPPESAANNPADESSYNSTVGEAIPLECDSSNSTVGEAITPQCDDPINNKLNNKRNTKSNKRDIFEPACGVFKNVFLSEIEKQDLFAQFGENNVRTYLEMLSRELLSSRADYGEKTHAEIIRSWIAEDSQPREASI